MAEHHLARYTGRLQNSQDMTDSATPPPTVSQTLAADFGLSAEEYAKVLEIMGRTPSLTELGVFSVMWSEHCSLQILPGLAAAACRPRRRG